MKKPTAARQRLRLPAVGLVVVGVLFLLGWLLIGTPQQKGGCPAPQTEVNCSTCFAHLHDEAGWAEPFYRRLGLGPGECIRPSDVVSPCQLRCAPTRQELRMARIAWKYFENNFNEKTGLFNAAHQYPSAATWDWANAVFATYAAYKFCLIDRDRYLEIMNKFLTAMQKLPLFNNELPNKTYNTRLAKMSDYTNKPLKEGNGWSAADLARLLSALNLVEQCEQTLAPQIEKLVLRFRYCRALSVEGDLYGGTFTEGKLHINHEALTGYEEYLARGYMLWHHDASEARKYKFVEEVDVYGVKIPTDTRPFFSNFVESEPFWYLGFEYGVDDPESGRYIKNMYRVQEERFKRTGQLTAVTEDNIDRRPYFLFNTVYTHGEPWKTINQMGEDYDEYKTVSSKAGIGMRYLFDTPYANRVYNYLRQNYDPQKGYYAGIYEKMPGPNKAMSLNTNAVILEAMVSSKMGPLQNLHTLKARGTYDYYRNNINNFRCLPTQNKPVILEPYGPEMAEDNESCVCSDEAKSAAKIAWVYFENNYHPKTGYVNGTNKYKIIRPEHIGRTIMATIAARELDVIYPGTFDTRMDRLLGTLQAMPLYFDELPNTYYDAETGKMVTRSGEVTSKGRGWNLYSIAQLLTGLYYLQRDYPKHREAVFRVVARWDFKKRAIAPLKLQDRWYDGKSKGGFTTIIDPAKEYYIHAALKLFNIESYSHFLDERNLDYKAPYLHEVPMGFAHRVTNGESYLWAMMELPYHLKYKHYASNIYLTLKDRYLITKKPATSSEEPLDRKPYWIENDIYSEGKLWSDRNHEGKSQKHRNVLSTKAAFIYDALYGYTDDYANTLMALVKEQHNDAYGWYGGLYGDSARPNKSINVFTNAAVLEAMLYRRIGNFYYAGEPALYDRVRLHRLQRKGGYFVESLPIALRYDAQKVLQSLAEEPHPVRVERKGDDFVVRIGVFESEKTAVAYLNGLTINVPGAHVAGGPVDADAFLLSNRVYAYNYHRPDDNLLLVGENKPYAQFLKRYKAEQAKKKR